MSSSELSAVEAERYDRQIRLWGIESQEKLRAANVLLIGIRALGSEIAKNILLCGINSLTILDSGEVTKEEQIKNFLLPPSSIGSKVAEAVLPKAQALNPLVKIITDTEEVDKKDEKYYRQFTIVIATLLDAKSILKIDEVCRKNKVQFICGDVFGMFGFSLLDFLHHEYYIDEVVLLKNKRKANEKEKVSLDKATRKKTDHLDFPSLQKVLIFPNEKQKSKSIKQSKRRNELFYLLITLMEFRTQMGRNPSYETKGEDVEKLISIKKEVCHLYKADENKLGNEVFDLIFDVVPPVCAIVGGVIAQEVIKAVSHKEVPINNVFLFNPCTYAGKEESVCN